MSDQVALHWLLECADMDVIGSLVLAAAWVVNRSFAPSASMRNFVWVMASKMEVEPPGLCVISWPLTSD